MVDKRHVNRRVNEAVGLKKTKSPNESFSSTASIMAHQLYLRKCTGGGERERKSILLVQKPHIYV